MSLTKTATWAANPVTARGETVHLSVDAKGERIIYANGRSIFVRGIDAPNECIQYCGHVAHTTTACISPSGRYVASGDRRGNVHVWDLTNSELPLQCETQPISGRICDIAWDGESKRIIAVGDGRDRFGHAFTSDTANSVGEISGHSAVVTAVSMRAQRPFRAATGSDDASIVFYHGAPYKFARYLREHTRFVHDVAFSPDGAYLASVGADGKIFLYDGKTGDTIKEVGLGADSHHVGTIFACSWDPTSSYVATAGADGTIRTWSVADNSLVRTWDAKSPGRDALAAQQVGIVWTAKGVIISLSMDGTLTYYDPEGDVQRVVQGHQKAITAVASMPDLGRLFTASYDGRMLAWDTLTGLGRVLDGAQHANQVTDITTDGSVIVSVAMDDTLRSGSALAGKIGTLVLSTDSLPKGVAVLKERVWIVATVGEIQVVSGEKRLQTAKTPYQPSAVATRPGGVYFAVGGEDHSIHLHSLSGSDGLAEVGVFTGNRAAITRLAFSPDGKYLAAGDSLGKVVLYDAETREVVTTRWVFHAGRITGLAWHANSTHIATSSLDTNVHIYNIIKPLRYIGYTNAHSDGACGVAWETEDTLLTAGSDACVKKWSVSL